MGKNEIGRAVLGGALVLVAVACKEQPGSTLETGRAESVDTTGSVTNPPPRESSPLAGKERHMAALDRLREAAGGNQIERVMMPSNDKVGVVIRANVEREEIPALANNLLAKLEQEFANEDLEVSVYSSAPTPVEIGVARLDSKSKRLQFTWSKETN